MPKTPRFSVIIPAHNEEARIERTLRAFLDEFGDSEVIVVLNGCTDAAPEIVRATVAGRENAKVVELKDAIGKGGAVRVGFLLAQAPIVAYVDADGATSPAELRRLCEMLGPSDFAIIGSRWLPGATVTVKQAFRRRVASRTFNLLVRAMFGLPYSDTQCGAKVFRRDKLRDVMANVDTANFAFDVDLLYALKKSSISVREVPTTWRDVDGSRVRLVTSSLKMFASLLRLRIRYSILKIAVPAFDRFFPTNPIKLRDGLRILILNGRDPVHPQAGAMEAYLYEVGRRWAARGHTVQWLTGSFPGAARIETVDGMKVKRAGGRVTAHVLVPAEYLRSCRDQFDVVIDCQNEFPFFSPLYSLKPKMWVTRDVNLRASSSAFERLKNALVRRMYRGSTFVACTEERLAGGALAPESNAAWDAVAAEMLEHVIQLSSGDTHGLTRIENQWSLIRKRSLTGEVPLRPPAAERVPIDVTH